MKQDLFTYSEKLTSSTEHPNKQQIRLTNSFCDFCTSQSNQMFLHAEIFAF